MLLGLKIYFSELISLVDCIYYNSHMCLIGLSVMLPTSIEPSRA
ncbi:hypothetical protein DSUL_60050 [Desulfovibrionales bacterium]